MASFGSFQDQSDKDRSTDSDPSLTRPEENHDNNNDRDDQMCEYEASSVKDYVSESDSLERTNAKHGQISADKINKNNNNSNDIVKESDENQPECVASGARFRRALHFLSHPSLVDISSREKESYLQSKGYSKGEIKSINNHAAEFMKNGQESGGRTLENLDRIWDQSTPSTSTRFGDKRDNPNNQLHNSRYAMKDYFANEPLVDQSRLPDVPSPIVPMTVGGALVVFGMAAFRWLNGGDFVLFPSSVSSHDSRIVQQDEGQTPSPQSVCEKASGTNQDDMEASSHKYLSTMRTLDNAANIQSQSQQPEELDTVKSALSQDLQCLTAAIEKYTSTQVEIMRTKANEKAKDKTDNAMVLLKQQQQQQFDRSVYTETSNKGSDQELSCRVSSSMQLNHLVQIIETKCTLEKLLEKVNSISSLHHGEESATLHEILEKLNVIHENINSIKLCLLNQDVKEKINVDEHREEYRSTSQIFSDSGTFKDEKAKQTETTDVPSDNDNRSDTCSTEKHVKESDSMNCNQDAVCSNQIGKEALEDAIKNFKENNTPMAIKATCQMLSLYVTNLEENPTNERYQKIYTTSNKFKTLIANVPYAKEILYALGFVEDGSFLKWKHFDGNESESSVMMQLLKESKMMIKALNNEHQQI
jgi:hypothetical protein